LVEHLIIQIAEPAREGNMLLGRQMLVTQRDDAMVEMGLMDGLEVIRR
jgi:hypothetical protein